MIKKFISMSNLIRLIESNEQPKTIFIRNDSGSDTKLNWFECTKEYFTEAGNSILFKLRKETLFAQYTIYYYDEVLDETEKAYLRNVIRPFRKEVAGIKKIEARGVRKDDMEYIAQHNQRIIIKLKDGWNMAFPWFDECEKKMYSGMDLNRCYTIEELGL